jgi:hypothetical protein
MITADRRRDSKALPCKSFEPIGRHVRIVRVTLQDCRPGRLRGPTPRNITLPRGWPLLAPHARHFVPYQQSNQEVNPQLARFERPQESSPAVRNRRYRHVPDLRQKFADPERRLPDSLEEFPVHERREFAAKSLIVRIEVGATSPEQAIFGGNSL